MSALEPYLGIVKAVAVIGLILGLFGAGHHFGAQGERLEREKERAATAEATIALNRSILRSFEVAADKSQKEKERAKAETDKLRADLAAGTLRLSVAVDSCKTVDPGAGNPEARAELLPAAAERIGSVGIDGDDAVRDLNECIDKYNAVKESFAK